MAALSFSWFVLNNENMGSSPASVGGVVAFSSSSSPGTPMPTGRMKLGCPCEEGTRLCRTVSSCISCKAPGEKPIPIVFPLDFLERFSSLEDTFSVGHLCKETAMKGPSVDFPSSFSLSPSKKEERIGKVEEPSNPHAIRASAPSLSPAPERIESMSLNEPEELDPDVRGIHHLNPEPLSALTDIFPATQFLPPSCFSACSLLPTGCIVPSHPPEVQISRASVRPAWVFTWSLADAVTPIVVYLAGGRDDPFSVDRNK
mmetsp:Transcript_37637/g.78090  ORF Transcript_37637/g.78090 Transcript_37637/m.78090 type:complete len:258 (-) Transcript_37637:2506-3279(-)